MQQVSDVEQFLATVEAWSPLDQAPVAISRIESGESASAQPIQASVYDSDFKSSGFYIDGVLDEVLFASTGDGFGTPMEPTELELELDLQRRAAVRKEKMNASALLMSPDKDAGAVVEPMEAKITQNPTRDTKRRKVTDSRKVITSIKGQRSRFYGRNQERETTEFFVFYEKEENGRWMGIAELGRIMNK